jgi:hypothetical protein
MGFGNGFSCVEFRLLVCCAKLKKTAPGIVQSLDRQTLVSRQKQTKQECVSNFADTRTTFASQISCVQLVAQTTAQLCPPLQLVPRKVSFLQTMRRQPERSKASIAPAERDAAPRKGCPTRNECWTCHFNPLYLQSVW